MNKIDLTDKTAVVTGAARGIGRAIAERLTASGGRCAIWDRDEAAAVATANEIDAAIPITVDVTDADSVQAAAAATLEQCEGVDLLVNNAGIAGSSKLLWDCTADEWQEVLQIDLFGVFLCCRTLVPQMIERGYGRIVNIASIAGKEGNPKASHYSAAKAGVIGLTKSLAKECAQNGVLVNCVTPAVIETDILKQISQEHIDYMLSKIPMARFGLTEEAAALVAWLCSEDCSFSTGAVFDLSGGRATY